MEEFRPILVDALVLYLVNRRVIRATDFFRPEDREPAAFDFAETEPAKEGYPIILTHEGMKKFITYFERRLQQKVLYEPQEQRLTYRDVLLAQTRQFVRLLEQDDSTYQPFLIK
jgi:CRISPR-associated protein Cas1